MTKAEIKFMLNCRVTDMASYLMEDENLSLQDALSTIYDSKVYEKLTDLETGLYYQSSEYNYELLLEEIKNKKLELVGQ